MTINSKLGFGALALTLMSLGIAQQSAEPTQAIPPSSAVTVQDNLHSILSKNVSGELKNAPIAEVVSWLSGQGLSFVIKDGDVDGLLTMSIKDQPLDQAAEAIADALGGHWVRHGNVFTWHKGAESPGWATAPTIARGDHDLSIIMPKTFTWSGDAKDHDKLLKELKIFTDQSGKQLDLKQFEGMEIPMMELQTELGKELGTLNLKGLELKAMEPAMQESIAKALKEVHGFKLDAKQLKAMKAPMRFCKLWN